MVVRQGIQVVAVGIAAGLAAAWLAAPALGGALLTLGSLGTLAILLVMVRREPQVHTVTMAFGALPVGSAIGALCTPSRLVTVIVTGAAMSIENWPLCSIGALCSNPAGP